MKIAVGLSGGVDSAVAALLLKEQGHEVICVTMKIVRSGEGQDSDAEAVAKALGLPHRYIELYDEYDADIIQYIRDDYLSGRTPNPCVKCNREIKFGIFLDRCREAGVEFDKFATGHYAGIYFSEDTGRYVLRMGEFAKKDQAYFLSLLTQQQLSQIVFPLADMKKPDVRRIAEDAGLFVSSKKESQDLCLGSYRNFLDASSGEGYFRDYESEEVLGRHRGFENYTIGQRKGLGVSAAHPLYVVSIDTVNNVVYLGPEEALYSSSMVIGDITWGKIEKPELPFTGRIKIRYRDAGAEAVLKEDLGDGRYLVEFIAPRRAVTPGQLAVCYEGDVVCFAGFIEK